MNSNVKIFTALFFQVGWFICVLSNNTISLAFTFLFIFCHFLASYFLIRTFSLKREISWLALGLAMGFICETLFFNSGILYQTDADTRHRFNGLQLPPVWLLCLWSMFALTLRSSLSAIFHKPVLTCLLALAVAPSNYYAGASLNAQVDIGQPLLPNLVLLGITWSLAMACLIAVHNRHFKDA